MANGNRDQNRVTVELGSNYLDTDIPLECQINPVTGFPIKGRHYAHRLIDPETGNALREIPASDIRVFGDKPHWLKGYQEVPKQYISGGTTNNYVELDLTSEEIKDLIAQGYVIEEHN